MKEYLLSGLLLASLGTIPAWAQDQGQSQSQGQNQPQDQNQDQGQAQGNRRQQFQDRMAEYADRLKLNDDQKQQVGDILRDELQKSRDIRQKYRDQAANGDRRAATRGMMREMKGVQDETDGRVSKVLNKDQMNEWYKIREENRQRMRDNMQQRRRQKQDQQQ